MSKVVPVQIDNRLIWISFDGIKFSGGKMEDYTVRTDDMARIVYHQVKIDRVVNGFVIEIGCKKFVCEKWDVLAKRLAEYWDDPVAAERKYCK